MTDRPNQYSITRIPAFTDNYLWLISDGRSAAIVDPGDAGPVIAVLEERALKLEYILTTHHHPDHIGGVQTLTEKYQPEVIGPASQYIPQVTKTVSDGDHVQLLGLLLQVITVPGHTLDHIAYFVEQPKLLDHSALFCGDTLFAGGCGRVFEGTFPQMRASLAKLKQLPADTRIYCAHEYTQANLAFALAVEPENTQLKKRVEQVAEQRLSDLATVPSSLADELATNPFLRYDTDPVIAAARLRKKQQDLSSDEVFAAIREWKDQF